MRDHGILGDYTVVLRVKHCLQAESTAITDGDYSVGERTDRTGDQNFDDIFDFLTVP